MGQRTTVVRRLVWRIHELDPARSPGILNSPKYRNALVEWLAGQSGIVAELALQDLADTRPLVAGRMVAVPEWVGCPHSRVQLYQRALAAGCVFGARR